MPWSCAGGGSDGSGGGGGGASRARYYEQYERDISPEDIFNMFFGFPVGGATGATMYTTDGRRVYVSTNHNARGPRGMPQRAPRGAAHNRPTDDEVAGARIMQLVQLLPILLLVIFTLFSFTSLASEERYYSLQQEAPYLVERRTISNNIVPNLPYYVKDDFIRKAHSDRYLLPKVRAPARVCAGCGSALPHSSPPHPQVERAVESDLYTQLNKRCSEETHVRRGLEQRIRYATGAGKERLQRELASLHSPACDAFSQYFGKYTSHTPGYH